MMERIQALLRRWALASTGTRVILTFGQRIEWGSQIGWFSIHNVQREETMVLPHVPHCGEVVTTCHNGWAMKGQVMAITHDLDTGTVRLAIQIIP